MNGFENLYERIRQLPLSERLRLLERLARDAAEESARLQQVATTQIPDRGRGMDAGKYVVPDDFDDPLPAEIQRYFEGHDDDGSSP